MTSTEETKEQSYADLDTLLCYMPVNSKFILLGDFNTRVSRDSDQWRGMIVKHGVGKINSNGLLLLSKCAENDLLITNTTFKQDDKYKTTWMHPQSKHYHLTDSSFAVVTERTSSSPGQCVMQIAGQTTDLFEPSLTCA